jgi:hypothetical protein
MKQGETPTWVISKRLLRVTSGNIKYSVLAVGKSCSTNVRPLSSSIDLNRYLPIAVSIALPGAFIITVQQFPDSWATRYHQHITNLLHLFLFLASAQPQTDIRELGFFALVMVSFDVFQRALDRDASTPRSGNCINERGQVQKLLLGHAPIQIRGVLLRSQARRIPKRTSCDFKAPSPT